MVTDISEHIKTIIKENLAFLLPGFLFWSGGGFWLYLSNKRDIHLWFDKQHFPIGDYLFKYITYLGDGFLLITVIVLLFIVKRKFSAKALLYSFLSSTLIVQVIKRAIPQNPRPHDFFYGQDLYRVQGVNLLIDGSFPSGHSAGAICLFFVLASFTHRQGLKFILGIAAILVCLSRIYLNQHFLIDTIAGGIIAFCCTVLVLSVLRYKENAKAGTKHS